MFQRLIILLVLISFAHSKLEIDTKVVAIYKLVKAWNERSNLELFFGHKGYGLVEKNGPVQTVSMKLFETKCYKNEVDLNDYRLWETCEKTGFEVKCLIKYSVDDKFNVKIFESSSEFAPECNLVHTDL
jgi:hypothetical protein